MKFTLDWLKQHLETEASLDEIAETLTMIGLEVEEISDPAKDFAPFTVGYVVEAKKHPNADRLSVCLVDTGTDKVQVICGAPNARTGMKGVFAPAGVRIPGTGLDLKKGMIRGEESNGMLCSEREMGISDEHEGIIELPEDAPVGAPFAQIMGLDDPVIEIAITPNRQDCLGVHGIARDLAAAGLGTLKPFDASTIEGAFESPIRWVIDLPSDKAGACPMVVGRTFRGLKNGPSPDWLQRRLRAIGLRPISALVDITNFVTYDLGRPLHVFDADKLACADGALVMRMARDGEEIPALDGKSYTLDAEMTVIADDQRVQGIGGIMGGELSGCTEETQTVFLEVALFDEIRTAASGRRLGIESDARYRFERGVDPESALWGAEVAARLIMELCGGQASALTIAGKMPDWQHSVPLSPDRVRKLGGVEIADREIQGILERLGYGVSDGAGTLSADVPSWRRDVTLEADLIEDVLRIYGYDNIPAVPMSLETALPETVLTPAQRRRSHLRRELAARGMLEAVTWSFMRADWADLFAGDNGLNPDLRVANPISSELDFMRPGILPNLIEAAGRNTDRGYPDIALFEVGPQYADDTPSGQAMVAAGVRAGNSGPRHWQQAPRPVDAFDVKADALAALGAAGAPVDKLQVSQDAPRWYHPGRSGGLRLGPNLLAWFGEVHPRILRTLDVKGPMVAFELFLDNLPEPKRKDSKTRALLRPSPFQRVERDFAFVVDADVPADKVVRAAKGADKTLIAEVSVFDVYTGAGVGEGKTSLAISVTLQPTDKTLTDAEIDAVAQKIIANVSKQTGGVLRG
ncbi:MAG: phenylalanine--tRNA ligase subunit beta [Alphaproteobacteria bacterium]|nr:phenylalanine--tRNA ligase subunit beta [Alphaproteobacteria bacterium]